MEVRHSSDLNQLLNAARQAGERTCDNKSE